VFDPDRDGGAEFLASLPVPSLFQDELLSETILGSTTVSELAGHAPDNRRFTLQTFYYCCN